MNEAQQADLLDLELSHDDVDKPVSNDGMDLFSYDDVTEPMLGNNIDKDNNNNNKTNNASSTNIDIGYTGNSDNKTPQNNTDASNAKCWNVQYYQPYFDLDTSDELIRIRKALLPFLAGEFYDKDLDEKPDLYGPFWITTTLAFLMAAMGNFAAYINTNEETVGEW
eukprot:CAMPEP_0201578098 /NCGR_PEP_ID=MMETSP0190_2-20130828/24809_1 /ASSEMBLY_ACC=CAM_ASM_000263 /TAXON_ID=37353 /ORGANISM="Rosalina sp." /LENGTH=165 /DNA_ID=CAMNT_0048010897 /DNA_START=88 /DNA_END=582 /DNA_ORIENTATION=+